MLLREQVLSTFDHKAPLKDDDPENELRRYFFELKTLALQKVSKDLLSSEVCLSKIDQIRLLSC